MKKAILFLGYAILTIMVLTLYGLSFLSTINEGAILVGVVMAIVLAGLFFSIKKEVSLNLNEENIKSTTFNVTDFYNFFSVVIGALLAYYISVGLGLGAVVAAGIVGVLAALLIPKFGAPTYCGSFVGMASALVLPSFGYVLLAGVIAGALFVISKIVFNGFGGKFGTIAVVGVIISGLIRGEPFVEVQIPHFELAVTLVIFSILAAVITMVISLRLGHGPVMGSAIVGLLAGIILPSIYPEIGGNLAVMVICASFAGMANYKRIPNEGYMAVAGLVSGLAFVYTAPYFGGCGGKLGTIAFGSVIAVRGVRDIALTFTALGTKSQQVSEERSP